MKFEILGAGGVGGYYGADAKARAVKNFLVNDLLLASAPERNPVGSNVSLRDVLE